MNCQKGELAIFVRSDAGNEGKIVKCLRLATAKELDAAWFVVAAGPVWVIDRDIPFASGSKGNLAIDSYLRPIRPEADPVTTDVVAGVEA